MGNWPWALFWGGAKFTPPTLGPWALPLGGPKVPHYYWRLTETKNTFMRDSMAQQKRHTLWFRTKKTEIDKGWYKGEDQGKFDRVSLEGETRRLYAENMDLPPEEGNFCDDSKRAMKPQIVARYNWHMGYVDISDRMANTYSMCRHTFKWTTKIFFHLLDLTVLEIVFPPSGSNSTQQLDSVIFMWG